MFSAFQHPYAEATYSSNRVTRFDLYDNDLSTRNLPNTAERVKVTPLIRHTVYALSRVSVDWVSYKTNQFRSAGNALLRCELRGSFQTFLYLGTENL